MAHSLSARQKEIDRQALALSPPTHPLLANLATFLLLGLPVALAMTGILGGGPHPTRVSQTSLARLQVTAPEHVRSGTIGEIDIRLSPREGAANPAIVLPDEWLRGVTINDTGPEPIAEKQVEGGTRMEFAPIPAGGELHLSLSFQINPDRLGSSHGRIEAMDGQRPLAALPVRMTVLP